MFFLSRPNNPFGIVHIIEVAVAVLLNGISFGRGVGLIVHYELKVMPDFNLDVNLEAQQLRIILAWYPH